MSSSYGSVETRRSVPPVGGGFSPLDEELGLLPQVSVTPTLAESAVRLGTWLPFGVAAAMLEHFVHTQVSESTITRLTERAGAAYVAVQAAQYAQLQAAGVPAVPGPPLQQVSVDGAFVPLVQEAWTEAKTVAIGTVQPPVRQADGTIAIHTTDLSYFSRAADCRTFTEQATIEIVRRGTASAGTVAGVLDGAVWEQGFLDVHRPDAVRILDWCHGVGYLAAVAQALYGAGTPAQQAWLAAQRETLLHGDPQVVLARLRGLQEDLRLQAGAGRPPAALAVITESLDYLTKRADQLRYAEFRALGYPIGSGAVESANKLVVEARLKGAGMHWALAHVNPLLALRTLACSDRWAEGWPQLTHQWRTQARATVLAHRTRRQDAQQAARDQAATATLPPAADEPPPPLLATALGPTTEDALPSPLQRQGVHARTTRPPTAPPPTGRATPPRPAATHPWRAPLLPLRSSARPDPGI